MEYISAKELSSIWKITQNRITILCKTNRIEGAKLIGKTWMIPLNSKKPVDARTLKGKEIKNSISTIDFRYPDYINRRAEDYFPPLSKDELILKKTQELFYEGHFIEAENVLGDLAIKCENKYIKIMSLYYATLISEMLCNIEKYNYYYTSLKTLVEGNFQFKKEMETLIHEIDAIQGDMSYFTNDFDIDTSYNYHQSFVPHLFSICATATCYSAKEKLKSTDFSIYELNCNVLEQQGYYYDAQLVHCSLAYAYNILNNKEKAINHIIKVVDYAYRYNLYFCVGLNYYYFSDLFNKALDSYPKEFTEMVITKTKIEHDNFVRFMKLKNKKSVYTLLNQKDYNLIYYALQGLSNKEISFKLKVSEVSVSNYYHRIFDILKIKNKTELVKMFT